MGNNRHNRKARKGWIKRHDLRLALGVAIEEDRLNFASVVVIGRWFERFGPVVQSVNPRLLLDYDEAMRRSARDMRRSKVIEALDQRVFRRKHKKPDHFTRGAVFSPLGHGRSPVVVVPT